MEQNWEEYRKKIIGLGDSSMKKTYFPELQEKIRALETNQGNLQSIISVLPVGVVIHTNNGKVLSYNPLADALMGITQMGNNKTLLSFATSLPDFATLKEYWKNAATNQTTNFEWVILNLNGEAAMLETTVNPIIWDNQEALISVLRDVTRQKEHEQELIDAKLEAENSKERYKALFEQAADGIVIGDIHGFIIDVNESFCTMSGYSSDEIIGNTPRMLFALEEMVRKPLQYHELDAGKIIINERKMTHKTGQLIDVQMSSRLLTDGRYQSIFRDVTEINRAQVNIRESEERFNSALQAVNEGIWDWNITEKKVFFDNRYYTLAGYIPLEFPATLDEWEKRIHPDDLAFSLEKMMEHIDGKTELYDIEFRFLRKDNSWMWIRGRGKIIEKDTKGKAIRMIGTHTDITDRKTIENELIKYKNHLEELVKERTDEIEQLNEELVTSNEELRQLNDELIIQKDHLENLLEELRSTQEQLLQSEKLASIGVLTAGIAHEINNPINFISSGVVGLEQESKNLLAAIHFFSQHFSENSDETMLRLFAEIENKFEIKLVIENIPKLINSIKVGVERTTNIVKGLRTFSRLDSENRSEVDVHELIDSALTLLYNKYKNYVTIEKKYTAHGQLSCFPGKLSQVFLNIIMNAVQAIETEGTVSISTSINPNSKMLEISVSDTGCGIPEHLLSKIFDPFFTTKQVGQGTGLGLPIVLGIVKDHGGNIQVNSEVGKGTTFLITLPIL
jgi:PAS domain S-box-containing protein